MPSVTSGGAAFVQLFAQLFDLRVAARLKRAERALLFTGYRLCRDPIVTRNIDVRRVVRDNGVARLRFTCRQREAMMSRGSAQLSDKSDGVEATWAM